MRTQTFALLMVVSAAAAASGQEAAPKDATLAALDALPTIGGRIALPESAPEGRPRYRPDSSFYAVPTDGKGAHGTVYEIGRVDGVLYRIGDDFSASVGTGAHATFADLDALAWDISCFSDDMEGVTACGLSWGAFLFMRTSSGTRSVGIGGGSKAYPGSEMAIKIDDAPPIRWPENAPPRNAAADRIIGAMKAGQSALTRWYDWPGNSAQDRRFEIHGLARALAVQEWALTQAAAKAGHKMKATTP